MEIAYLTTIIGNIKIELSSACLEKISFVGKDNTFSTKLISLEMKKICSQLKEYFSGKRNHFDLKINLQGTTFQKKVWEVLSKIPYGETISYSNIALLLGNKNLTRAVANALHKNKLPIILACHRVIGKDGSLKGYFAGKKIKEKLILLEKKYQNNFI